MAKFPEAASRLFKNVFVCRNCKTKIRSTPQKIIQKKVACRKCGKKVFRAIKKSQQKAGAA
ncbi:MAG: hypothetical protein ABIB47_03475 [Candidatus Woesearchaeota archaeon]